MERIEEIHKINKQLVLKYNLEIGDELILLKSYKGEPIGKIYKIDFIHPLYYWVLVEGRQLPQEVEELLNICKIMKGGINKYGV